MIAVVLSRPHKFDLVSLLIRKMTDFDASHASLHIQGRGLFDQERMVFEATSHGIGLVHPTRWDKNNLPVHAFQMTEEVGAGRASFKDMWSDLGASYDFKGLFSFAFRIMASKLWGVKASAEDTPDSMFCSELVARWLNGVRARTGSPLKPLHPDEVSPAGLFTELEGSPLFKAVSCEPSLSAIFT